MDPISANIIHLLPIFKNYYIYLSTSGFKDMLLKTMSLKAKLILGGIAAVIIPFAVAGTIIYMQLSGSLLEMSKEKSAYFAKDLAAFIDANLMQSLQLAESIAADPVTVEAARTGDFQTAQLEIEAIHERIGEWYFNIFITDKNGIARADVQYKEQLGLDLSDRAYFLKAKEGKATAYGPIPPRGTATPEVPVVMVCAPIQDRNEFLGVVTIPYNIYYLVDIISRKKVGRTGYAYLINADGLVLIHPQKEFILNMHLFAHPGTEELERCVRERRTDTVAYTFGGADKIAGLAHMAHTNWTVVFTQDKAEIMAPVNKLLRAMYISAAIVLILTITAIVYFSGRFSSPIQKLMETMRLFAMHSTEIIFNIGLDHKIFFANPAFEKITGIPAQSITDTEPELRNTRNVPEARIWASVEAGTPWSGRVLMEDYKSDTLTLDVMLVPLKDDHDSIQGYLFIGRDITSDLMVEKRLQQGQKLEAIGTLAGGIAHDFNNILSGIFGFAELSLIRGHPDPETEANLREIIRASERARDLVSQILTFSRRTDVELRPLMPQSVIKEALKLLRASTPATIEIRSDLKCDLAIRAEPTQIHQVIMNLFTNAIHAIGDQTGTITLTLKNFWVDEDFTRMHPDIQTGQHVFLRIADTGEGMPPETVDKIFEPFFTTKTQGRGTGLGLSVVHGIVKKWDGIVSVYSAPGKGTQFNIIIPAVAADTVEPIDNQYLPIGGKERIAIVDDETAITATMGSILEKLGYHVTVFSDGLEAEAVIKEHPADFDLLITDYTMPRITGLELARRLKKEGIRIPVVMVSGYYTETIIQDARNEGITQMITKPVNSYRLTDAIHKVLSKHLAQ